MQPVTDARDQRHRVVRGVHATQPRDPHPVDVGGLRQCSLVHRVRLEHRQGVEGGRRTDGTLDLREPEMVVIEEGCLLGLDPGDQLGEGQPGVHGHPDGQGVDEQADHRLYVREVGGPPGDGCPEDDVPMRGQCRHHDTPCGLHQGVHGDAEITREAGQIGRQARRGTPGRVGGGDRSVTLPGREQRRLVQSGESVAPCSERGLTVPRGQPCEEVAILTRRGKRGGVAPGCVQVQQVLQQQRGRPAVQEHVVVRRQHPVPSATEIDEGEPDQRRGRHVETARAIGGEQLVVGGLDVVGAAEIDFIEGQFDVGRHHLHGFTRHGVEGDPQVRVPAQQGLARSPKALGVDRTLEVENRLHHVRVEMLAGELRVEEQSFLQRRERPDIGQIRIPRLQVFDTGLIDGDQWQIRRRAPAGTGGVGVCRQRGQRLDP